MADIIKIGILFVHLALIFYTLFMFFERKEKRASNRVITFITIAIISDIIATSFMMIGATQTYFTLHGIIGYTGLLLMIIVFVLLIRFRMKSGSEVSITKGFYNYMRIAYIGWLIAFFTGAAVSIFRH
ncbi:MAG: hypothetical protein B6D44_01355 [Ignavibacteriales bacterium UTCHB2]|jgi:F0F1-type ATP synthase assembly protein I|nr:MAG: hypothetical protein BWY38_00781 [Ignavibacteria bacterium ADurb.Bin266]OQY75475.1 MAG: hypothetical protein B6D44_01355 [Ignavibacteriales bacterium UTCHB2]HQI39684.1 hypothetical protein [Ignavibacteriaceae bacterium]HQJ45117.1 hypothetical protein [Ignavibacteriaceae bacterium]